MRRPVWGEERVLRDFRTLRKLTNLVLFTSHGRRRRQTVWAADRPGPSLTAA